MQCLWYPLRRILLWQTIITSHYLIEYIFLTALTKKYRSRKLVLKSIRTALLFQRKLELISFLKRQVHLDIPIILVFTANIVILETFVLRVLQLENIIFVDFVKIVILPVLISNKSFAKSIKEHHMYAMVVKNVNHVPLKSIIIKQHQLIWNIAKLFQNHVLGLH